MPWFKVDDQLAFHPKAFAAGNAAMGLWVRAGSWCSAHLTEGALPQHMISTLGAQSRDAKRLVEAGLWERTDVGYQFKDWDDYQPTKQQVEADREAARDRQRRHREKKRNADTNDVSHGVTDGVTNAVSHGTPSRPVPSIEKETAADAAGLDSRDDVREICETLRDLMTANGCRTPTITKKWRDDARLLLDRDQVSLSDALAVLRWSQANDFWKSNILSTTKLRAKFDTMRLQMERDGAPLPATVSGLNDWLRKCWDAYDIGSIEDRSGMTADLPDAPEDVEDYRAFNLQSRRNWITENRDEIIRRIMAREANAA